MTGMIRLGIAIILLLCYQSLAEIPQMISYQGSVTDGSGIPVPDGTYDMRFRIYNAATGGVCHWDSGTHSEQVTGGIFNVLLGGSPHPNLDLSFDEDYWLLITIEGDNQTPRQRLGSTGYSYMASGLVPHTIIEGSVSWEDGTDVLRVINEATSGVCYGASFYSYADSGRAVFASATNMTGENYGGKFYSMSSSGTGVHGEVVAYYPGTTYGGYFKSNSSDGYGVYGEAPKYGIYGKGTGTSGVSYGGQFYTSSTSGRAIAGEALATTGVNYGGKFHSNSEDGRGCYGWATATTGVNYGGAFKSSSSSGYGVWAKAGASTGTTYGVYSDSDSPGGYGGYFVGDVHVSGSLSKSSGSFLIDHPLDPENKLLRHNFVESPENLLIYRGELKLNEDGEATVAMPEYFAALTREEKATIHLTAQGKPFDTGYKWETDHESFIIYGAANREVSWMVMAERDDPVIRRLGRPVEEEKGPDSKYCDKGKLLDPVAYGYPESMGRDHIEHE